MEPDQITKAKGLETYAEDMASAIEGGGEGLVKKIIHEQDKQDEEKKVLSPESKRNRLFISAGIMLIVMGIAAVVLFLVFKREIYTVTVQPQFVPIIFTDRNDFLEVVEFDKQQIANNLQAKAKNTEVKIGGIEGVYVTENKQIIGSKRFLALLESGFPEAGTAFLDDRFLIGLFGHSASINSPAGGDLFVLFKVRSFADIFPFMRTWEKKMLSDLRGILGIDINFATEFLLNKDFTDGFFENKNARMLYDNLGNLIMMYVFANDTTVVVARTPSSVHEAILRLASGEVRR